MEKAAFQNVPVMPKALRPHGGAGATSLGKF